jgi:hypothetical protein
VLVAGVIIIGQGEIDAICMVQEIGVVTKWMVTLSSWMLNIEVADDELEFVFLQLVCLMVWQRSVMNRSIARQV